MTTYNNKDKILRGIRKYKKLSNLVKPGDSDTNKELYIRSEEYLQSILTYFNRIGYEVPEVIDELKNTIASLNCKEQYKDDLKKKGYVFIYP